MTFQEARPSAPDGDRLQSLSLLRSEESDSLGILLIGPIGHDRADSPRGHRASLAINRRHGLLGQVVKIATTWQSFPTPFSPPLPSNSSSPATGAIRLSIQTSSIKSIFPSFFEMDVLKKEPCFFNSTGSPFHHASPIRLVPEKDA